MRFETNRTRRAVALTAVATLLLVMPGPATAAEEEGTSVTHDGLELVPDAQVAAAYVKPGADFTPYKRVMLLDTFVAFRANWQRDQNRGSVHHVTNRDIERMKSDMADLFREVFEETLSANDGFPVAEAPASDVLLLRPAIIDLDVTAPDLNRANRSHNFAASAGAATLFLELFDSVSGEILARAVDRQAARNPGDVMRWSNRVTNRAAAQDILRGWATQLRERLKYIQGRSATD